MEGELLIHYLSLWRPLGYFLVFFGMMIEGDLVLFTAAFLTHQGFFDLNNMLVFSLGGAFIGDWLWYLLGLRLSRFRLIRKLSDRVTSRFDTHLAERPFRTLFISKFTYGIGHLLLARAGLLRVKPQKFLKADVTAILIWALLVGGLGYLSSASFVLVRQYLRVFGIVLLIGWIVFFVVGERLLTKILKKRL